jgi:hypothetical protein
MSVTFLKLHWCNLIPPLLLLFDTS